MTTPPDRPKIYHITHIDNLASIVAARCIESDGRRLKQGRNQTSIGMTEIKRRRLFDIEVQCHPGSRVGDYVPFYFCPRSIMLFIIYKNNHMDMLYHGGQGPILHIQVDMESAIHWADQQNIHWAFSAQNAGTRYTDFYKSRNDLGKIDWKAVKSTDFRDPVIKEGKQAEFLIHDACPWHLVEKIGVLNEKMASQTNDIIRNVPHKPVVTIERTWYYY